MTPVPRGARRDLGLVGIVSTSLGILFGRAFSVAILSMPGLLGGLLVAWVEYRFEDWTSLDVDAGALPLDMLLLLFVFGLPVSVGAGLMAGPLAHLVAAVVADAPVSRTAALRAALHRPLVSVALGMVAVIGTLAPLFQVIEALDRRSAWVGLVLAALAGAAILGASGMALPALHREGRGLGRSLELGEGYRVAVAGTLGLLLVIALFLAGSFAATASAAIVYALDAFDFREIVRGYEDVLLLGSLSLAAWFVAAMMCIGVAVLRERLIEIKEPPDIARVLHRFD